MPINPEAVGSKGEPARHPWSSKDALLYAVGVGAGAVDPFDELAFTTENTNGVTQQVLPTMAVVLGGGGSGAFAKIGSFNPAMLVHGEQAIELHTPIPVAGRGRDGRRDHRHLRQGQGGGDRVPTRCRPTSPPASRCSPTRRRCSSAARAVGAETGARRARRTSRPRRRRRTRSPTRRATDQALLYRLSGDRNPLHSDPSFAAMGGFDKPILHGLCTYGFTGRALLHTLCDSDPSRFGSMAGRFSSPVMPGEALTVNMWVTGDGEAVFQTQGSDGRVVLDAGKVTFTA